MLSRRVSGGFVCLRCQLSLASRGRTRLSPLRTSIASTIVNDAPSRSYSESSPKPSWTGRLPIDEPHESQFEPHKPDQQTPDIHKPLTDQHREQHAAHTADPWQGAFDHALEGGKSRSEHEKRQSDSQETKHPLRRIGVRSKASPNSRSRNPLTLPTGPQFYTNKGQRLKPTNRSLPMDILGKPGHALVLRDAGPKRKRKIENMSPDESSSLLNLAKIYESTEVDVPSSREVMSNIHELKPQESVLPRREFDRVKGLLFKGFTKAQLAGYIQKMAVVQGEEGNGMGKVELRPWVLERWPWAPEVEGEVGAGDALLQGYVTKETSPKERLVVGLMRQCWGVGIRELQSRTGYLDVRVQDLQFDLLMLGNRRWLESISKSLFEPGTQIELIRSEKIVRVVAPKATAELILQEINGLLDKAQTRTLDATGISPTKLDQSILDEVGQITHTVVRYNRSGKKIEVSWIATPENQRAEGLEDLADVVFRLLYSAYGYKAPGASTMEVQPESYEVGGWYLADYHGKGKMVWKDRLARWARWAVATPRKGARTADPVAVLRNDILCRNLDASSSAGSFAEDGWSAEPQVVTRAVFGHVLHRDPVPSRVEEAFLNDFILDGNVVFDKNIGRYDKSSEVFNRNIGIHDQLDWKLERTLTPVVPPLKSLAKLTSGSEAPTTVQTSILMRFLPAPGNSSLPALELTLLTDAESDTLTPHSLRAVTEITTHDILLSSHPVDARLTDTTFYSLPGSSLAESCPELAAFLSQSDLRPQEGVLSTPSRPAPLSLPSRLLSSSSSSSSTTQPESLKASYIFSGLELRREVSTSVDGWKLSYTSVEAGQGGGRRAELALEGVRFGDEVEEEREMGAREFVDTLSRLVVGGELGWVGEREGGEESDGGRVGEEEGPAEVEKDGEERERKVNEEEGHGQDR